MKKIFLLMASVVIFATAITGCATKDARPTEDVNKTPESNPTATATESAAPVSSNFIGEEKAQEIALEKAGITSDDVIFEKIKLEKDDGVWQYEVEFRKDRTEYDADIKAEDGTIISWDVDMND